MHIIHLVYTELSPNATLEPGVDISLASPAFPLTKGTREPSKYSRRHYRGTGASDDVPPLLTKSSTLPLPNRSKHRSHSPSRSPYSSDQSQKRRVVIKRSSSSGRNSPPLEDFSQDSRHSDQYSHSSSDRSRTKHSRERSSRRVEYDSSRGREEIRSRNHHRKQQKSAIDFDHRKDASRYSRDQDSDSRRRRSPRRREGRDRYSDDAGRRRDNRDERPMETIRHRSPRYERKISVRKRDEGDEGSEGGVESGEGGGRIEDLIKEIQESTTDSSSDDQVSSMS